MRTARVVVASLLLLATGDVLAAPPSAATRTRGYANRAQIGALLRRVPSRGGSHSTSFVRRQPLLNRIAATLRVGVHTEPARARLARFVHEESARYDRPLSRLTAQDGVRDFDAFVAEKALTLAQFDRTPAQVEETFVTAGGTVGDAHFAPRRVFVQRWHPVERGPDGRMVAHHAPTGRVVLVSPGYLETGRDFHGQIDALTQQGDEVVVLDHQWAGHSDGTPGAVDRGYGVALYVAAAAAYADGIAHEEYGSHPGAGVVLTGTSMGAYAGVYGAMVLNASNAVHLDGPRQMPQGLPAVLQAPFRSPTRNATNRALVIASHVPGLRNLALPAAGLPRVTSDRVAQATFADNAVAGDVRSRASAFSSTDRDLESIASRDPAALAHPLGRVYVIHSEHDLLANTQDSRNLVARLGARGHLDVIPGHDHILSESPREMRYLSDGLRWVGQR